MEDLYPLEEEMNGEGYDKSFRGLVGSLIENSSLFPAIELGQNGEQLTVLDAIEKNELSLYVRERGSDRILDAVNCLTAIYDELKKDEPDSDFIQSTVGQLKEYL